MEITKEDVKMALYGEITDEITRGDDALLDKKIAVGKGVIYSYLNRFDTDLIFSDAWENDLLKQLCVNIIAWHIASVSSPNVHLDIIRTNYEDAIEFLESVQKGLVRPDWPIREDKEDTAYDEGGNIQWSSNKKRNNHF